MVVAGRRTRWLCKRWSGNVWRNHSRRLVLVRDWAGRRSYHPILQSQWRIALLASQPIQYWTVGPPVASAGVDQFGQGLFHGLQFGNLGPDFFDMLQGRAAHSGAGAVLVAVKRKKVAALFYRQAKPPRPGRPEEHTHENPS